MKRELYEEEVGTGVLLIRELASGDVVGMILVTKYNGSPCVTSYLQRPGGFHWYSQSGDSVKELRELRSYFYSDCDYCNNYPCSCTPEELAEYEREHAEWVKEVEASNNRTAYAERNRI